MHHRYFLPEIYQVKSQIKSIDGIVAGRAGGRALLSGEFWVSAICPSICGFIFISQEDQSNPGDFITGPIVPPLMKSTSNKLPGIQLKIERILKGVITSAA